MWRSTVLSLPLQLVFPDLIFVSKAGANRRILPDCSSFYDI
jgi:hypothetical protein